MGMLSQALFLLHVLLKRLFSQGFAQRARAPASASASASAARTCRREAAQML
jgi:hypothetical protein